MPNRIAAIYFQSYDDNISDVPVRVYTPNAKNKDSAMIVYFYGGGFVVANGIGQLFSDTFSFIDDTKHGNAMTTYKTV